MNQSHTHTHTRKKEGVWLRGCLVEGSWLHDDRTMLRDAIGEAGRVTQHVLPDFQRPPPSLAAHIQKCDFAV